MSARATPTVDTLSEPVSDTARLYQEGMIAGVGGPSRPPTFYV